MTDYISEALHLHKDAQMLKGELEIVSSIVDQFHKGGNTLEIGAYKGMTSYVILGARKEAKKGSRHHIVDVFSLKEGDINWPYQKHTTKIINKNLEKYQGQYELHKGLSLDPAIVKEYTSRKYDLIFIDGDHRHEVVYKELMLCDKLTDNITGHDYGHQGVVGGVDQFIKEKGYSLEIFNPAYGLFRIIKCETHL